MRKYNISLVKLVLLGAIWGSSFLFMKIAANTFGASIATFRLLIGAIFLSIACAILKVNFFDIKNIKHYCVVGFLNSTAPFVLFAISSKTVNSSVLSVINSSSVLWSFAISSIFLMQKIEHKKIIAFIIGVVGTIIANYEYIHSTDINYGVFFGLIATLCSALASIYIKRFCGQINLLSNVTGSLWFAFLFSMPFIVFELQGIKGFSSLDIVSIIILGVLCTGIAYLLFFDLIAKENTTFALTSALIIPIFAIIFGAVFLDEEISINQIIGSLMIMFSLKILLNISIRLMYRNFRKI